MAAYDYTYSMDYIRDGNVWNLVSQNPNASGTLDDGEPDPPDDTFSGNDPVGPNGEAYQGNIELNSEVFVLAGPGTSPGSTVTLYGNAPSSYTPPNSFPNNEVNNSPFTVCFAAGTLIATPNGETTVETLSIGDTLLTQDGREVPVKWVGRQAVHKVFTPAERFVPVRVTAGALGDGLPHTDLVLTAAHALIIDDVAIDAGALVNGTTITYDPIESLPDRVTYYHIETENHDVILANGAPAETFVDYVGRRAFDNFAEYVNLYGDERVIYEMDRPRVSAARLVPEYIRDRLTPKQAVLA